MGPFRPIDGGDTLGRTGQFFVRTPGRTGYEDGLSKPTGSGRASARRISDIVLDQPHDVDHPYLSSLAIFWGQLVDHDITLTETPKTLSCHREGEHMDIPIPTGDVTFDLMSNGSQVMSFMRASYCVDRNGVRQHGNGITSFLDNSMVYGSTVDVMNKLRAFEGGRLLMNDNMPPQADEVGLTSFLAMCMPGVPCYAFGDARANEMLCCLPCKLCGFVSTTVLQTTSLRITHTGMMRCCSRWPASGRLLSSKRLHTTSGCHCCLATRAQPS
jgi:hypothetical protein